MGSRGAQLLPSPQLGGVEVVILRLDVDPEIQSDLESTLSPIERRRADRFAFDLHRQRYGAARGFLRRILGSKLEVAPEAVELTTNPNGKPKLLPAYQDVRFSLSRSGDLAALALVEGREVGIDIEEIRDLPDAEPLAVRFFPPSELKAFRAGNRGFFQSWTRVEAVAKAKGEGLAMGDPSDRRGWEIHEFTPSPGFAGAIAVEGGLR